MSQPPTQLLRLRALGLFLILLLHSNSPSSPQISPINPAFKIHHDLIPALRPLQPEYQHSSKPLLLLCLPASTMPPIVRLAQGRWQISLKHKSGYVTPMPYTRCCLLIRLRTESKMAALIGSCRPLSCFSVSSSLSVLSATLIPILRPLHLLPRWYEASFPRVSVCLLLSFRPQLTRHLLTDSLVKQCPVSTPAHSLSS